MLLQQPCAPVRDLHRPANALPRYDCAHKIARHAGHAARAVPDPKRPAPSAAGAVSSVHCRDRERGRAPISLEDFPDA